MKKFLFAAIAMAAAAILCCTCMGQEKEVIRFHVKANSDSAEDQALKLQVRDVLLAEMNPALAEADDTGDARTVLEELIPTLQMRAEETIRAEGYDYPARVSLGVREFPTRNYQGREYPAGEYEALMVEIGEAKGENWWCVAYPTLCFVSESPKRSFFAWIRGWFD
jgi:stage II sporulation protein R